MSISTFLFKQMPDLGKLLTFSHVSTLGETVVEASPSKAKKVGEMIDVVGTPTPTLTPTPMSPLVSALLPC